MTRTLLRLDRDALFELLADHTDLLQGVFSTLAALARQAIVERPSPAPLDGSRH